MTVGDTSPFVVRRAIRQHGRGGNGRVSRPSTRESGTTAVAVNISQCPDSAKLLRILNCAVRSFQL